MLHIKHKTKAETNKKKIRIKKKLVRLFLILSN